MRADTPLSDLLNFFYPDRKAVVEITAEVRLPASAYAVIDLGLPARLESCGIDLLDEPVDWVVRDVWIRIGKMDSPAIFSSSVALHATLGEIRIIGNWYTDSTLLGHSLESFLRSAILWEEARATVLSGQFQDWDGRWIEDLSTVLATRFAEVEPTYPAEDSYWSWRVRQL